MVKALVTGGAGFIGSHIAQQLLHKGWAVSILDDLSSGKMENINSILDRIEFIEGGVNNDKALKQAIAGADYVFHEAAIVSVIASISDPGSTLRVNVEGTKNVLDAALGTGVKRVVFASSAAVYGNANPPIHEDFALCSLSPYGESKVEGEKLMREYMKNGLETVSLRYFNVYGPHQNPNSQYSGVITKFINKMLAGEPPVIYGDGNQTRDFIFVDDVVESNLLAAEKKGAAGEAFNIGTGKSLTINQLQGLLAGFIGYDVEPEYAPKREGDIYDSYADVSKALNLLNFKADISIEDGLKKTLEWQRGLK